MKITNSQEKSKLEILQKIKHRYKSRCGICWSHVGSAIITPCYHLFCQECFYEWIKTKYPDSFCPCCRSHCNVRDVINEKEISTRRKPVSNGFLFQKSLQSRMYNIQLFGSIMLYESNFSNSYILESLVNIIAVISFFLAIVTFILKI